MSVIEGRDNSRTVRGLYTRVDRAAAAYRLRSNGTESFVMDSVFVAIAIIRANSWLMSVCHLWWL